MFFAGVKVKVHNNCVMHPIDKSYYLLYWYFAKKYRFKIKTMIRVYTDSINTTDR